MVRHRDMGAARRQDSIIVGPPGRGSNASSLCMIHEPLSGPLYNVDPTSATPALPGQDDFTEVAALLH